MYRRPKFLEVLLEIRQEMARETDYDVDLYAEMIRSGSWTRHALHALEEPRNDRDKVQRPNDPKAS